MTFQPPLVTKIWIRVDDASPVLFFCLKKGWTISYLPLSKRKKKGLGMRVWARGPHA